MTYATRIARRIPPDPAQLQVLLGTLLGRGRLVSTRDGVRLVLALDRRHAWLAQWTYERLAPLAPPPVRGGSRVVLRSEPHPLLEDIAERLSVPHRLRGVVGPDAVRLWALYQRLEQCERVPAGACRCELVTPRRRRALAPAS